MKLKDLISIEPAIAAILDQSLPFALSYKLADLAAAIDRNKKFYSTKLNELIKQYAKVDDNGKPIQNNDGYIVQEDKVDECASKVEELDGIEISDKLPEFTIDEFSALTLTPRQAFLLKPLIK